MLTIWTDVEITRRKRYNTVTRPDGEIVFRSAYFDDVLDFLDAEEQTEAHLVSPRHKCLITHRRRRPKEERE